MTKKKKVALASGLTLGAIGASVGAVLGVTNYFVNHAIMRPYGEKKEDKLAPTYTKSQLEQQNIQKAKERVLVWKERVPPLDVYITSPEGLKLWANQYVQAEHSDYWLIAVHGYQSNHTTVQDYAEEYFRRNYNVLLPDLRGHGNSEGEYIGMGLHDSEDILLWINHIISMNPEAKIVLHGQSMGAATVMITAGQESLPKNVFAVVEDCGYTDSYQMMVEQLDYRYGLKPFPLMPLTNIMAEMRTNYDLKEASPMEFLKKATIPIMFIHGESDTFVLPYMQKELFEAYEGPKEAFTVKGADHVASRNIDYNLYYYKVFNFLEKYKPDQREEFASDITEIDAV